MKTPQTSFRIEPKILRLMDKIISDPPSVAIDGLRGAARNRTELIEVLVKKAAELQAQEKAK